ncbi:MAG: aminoacetone oxidase family FAD-binding enzyme [Ruminococcus sp.]|nr:aminoacetone oxidase family FAD-binding enzyme [Ruminococcus sp.]
MSTQAYAVIIGGGAAGIACACKTAHLNPQKKIVLLEKADRVGRKIMISGNGRCNLTNTSATEKSYHGEGAQELVNILFKKYNPQYVLDWFHSLGLLTVEENDGRVYPRSNHASSVLDVLRAELARQRVEVRCNVEVMDVKPTRTGYQITLGDETLVTQKLVIASGGKADYAYRESGSQDLFKMLGLRTNHSAPSLSPVNVKSPVIKMLKGVRANAKVTLYQKGEKIKEETGEVQFTENTLSGICVFNLSRTPNQRRGCEIGISLLPEMSKEEISNLLRERIKAAKSDETQKIFVGMFHKNIGIALLKTAKISPSAPASSLTEEDIAMLTDTVYDWRFETIPKFDMKNAQVTAGGVKVSDIIAEDFEHIAHEGLYIIGEALDVDGDCGGYNLQFAFASALCAAENLNTEVL